jgi:cobalamin biosynthesis protein CobD/CbiB
MLQTLKKLFTFRDKNQKIGILMGCFCFVPSFIVSWLSSLINPILGICILIISQYLWLTSIGLCCKSLESENIKLRQQLEEKDVKK